MRATSSPDSTTLRPGGSLRVLLLVCLNLAVATVAPIPAAEITWEPTAVEIGDRSVEAESGRLTVPEDRAAPAGAQVELALLRLPSTSGTPGAPVVYLAGGPGGSGIRSGTAPWLYPAFESLAADRDVILLDPRGVGASKPMLACRPRSLPQPEWFAEMPRYEEWMLGELEVCAAKFRADGVEPSHYNTATAADDLESLRSALGVEKMDLLGFSYGTHLALAALRRHPDSFERLVLVGTEGPDHTRKLPSALDTHLRRLSILAAQDPSIGEVVPDAADLLARLRARLAVTPLPVVVPGPDGQSMTLPLGADFLSYIILRDMGDTSDIPVLPALLATIERGDPSLAQWFVAKRTAELGSFVYVTYFAVDGASGASPERWARIRREAPDSLFAGVPNLFFPESAERLGIADLGDEFRGRLVSDVPTLFVSGRLDANAPPYQAEEIRWGLPRGEHLIVAHAGHEDMLGHPEVTDAIVDFLAGERVEDRRIAREPIDFLSIEEAKRDRGVE